MTRLLAAVLAIFITPVAVIADDRPNVIVFLADDLGWGEVGCYGQTKIRTPNIDQLATEGMRFTQHYSGSPVCASSRCTLMTGLHTGHAYVRGNKEMGGWGPDEPEGQLPLPEETVTLADVLKTRGYATAVVGKWGMGGPGSSGAPNAQGVDFFYGYLCQRVAHNYYPTHLWRNGEKDMLAGNEWFSAHQRVDTAPADYAQYAGETYAPQRMLEEAVAFIERTDDQPFFLLYASPIPHVALQVPDADLDGYPAEWDEKPYLGHRGYLPHPRPRAAYAAMVSFFDSAIGTILEAVERSGRTGETIVMVTSDNGPTFNGGSDSTFFESAGPFRGLKTKLYEGGIRVPLVVRWPGQVEPGTVSDHLCAFWDYMPTIAEAAGAEVPERLDGASLLPVFTGGAPQLDRVLYWEYARGQAVRVGKWKAVRPRGKTELELYDLESDIGESTNVAADHPDVVALLRSVMQQERVDSPHFPVQ